jgi:excisionase family DNA binding protein
VYKKYTTVLGGVQVIDRADVLAVSVAEAAALMNISRAKLYELIARGEIPSIRVGGRRLVRVEALRAFLVKLETAQRAGVGMSESEGAR